MTTMSPARMFGPLTGLLLAQGSALTANRILLVTLPWLVLTSTGSPAQTGLIATCQVVPFVVVQALSGPLLDRVSARHVSALGDLASACAIAVLALSGTPPIWMLGVIAAVVGAADGPATAAKAVMVPVATAAAGQPLERGTGITTAVERAATAAGPALAGLLIATQGVQTALRLAATLFFLAALTGLAITAHRRRQAGPGGYFQQLREGADFLHADTSLRAIVAMIVASNFIDQAFLTVLLPVWARDHGQGAELVGLAISAFATASVGTALITAWIGNRLPRKHTYLIGFTISGVSRLVVLACGAPASVVLGVFAVAGLGSGLVNPIISALTYERVPAMLQGRVNTLITAWAWSGIPFGGLAGAALLSAAGLTASLWCCSAAYLVAVLRPGWRVQWHRRPDRTRAAPVPAPEPQTASV
ncbi:putative drug antiporter protein precursor [Paractinoplanes durhamensis]|uniref:Multidrug efflux pump Tap n=2 Tax=Paractinoplanes durhamensis TaxID=113563 RepID=A0ABQ3YU44_9ACTN|nr:putative drug antiporter protein precursor [Actinoplanes durhamensis]